MASFYPCKKNDVNGYVFYVSLVSQANTKIMQANPTLAAGDVKVAVDDGVPANLGTLPAVDADFTKRVKVTLSQAETNGDNLTIIFSDAAGAEWCDLTINIQTVTRRMDDLAFPTTSGRSIDVDATGGVEITTGQSVASVTGSVGSVATGGITAASFGAGAIDAAAIGTAAIDADAIATDAIGSAELSSAAANKIADQTLRRTYANARASADGDAVSFRSLLGAIGKLVNKWSISGTTLTVFQEDDVTSTAPGGTQAITTTVGADPITALDTS